jgi:hypothetical protein
MRRNQGSKLRMALLVAVAVAWGAAPVARAAAPLATVNVGPTRVEWQPAGDFQKLKLTVSGPGGLIVQREFRSGTNPALELFGADGKPLPDGAYVYELAATPRVDPATRQALAAARAAGDDAAVAKLLASVKLPRGPLAQSGTFTVRDGSIVSPELREDPPAAHRPAKAAPALPTKDVVTADDAIIQGSLCVGLDCVVNETFGFDTIRLKENNTRIKFEDTSSSTGFATHDWQLTANDSASGGAEKFSIEDITAATVPFTITGSAPTNSVFVDSTGRVGFHTATPVLDLHVATGNTPAMRLEQTSASGFTAQTWDVAGNEANFFVRDVTGGSRLPFRIRPGAPTSSIDIAATGKVGIGTASPDSRVTVKSLATNGTVLDVVRSGGTNSVFSVFETTSGDGLVQIFDNTGAEAFRMTSVSGGRLSLGCNSPQHSIDIGNVAGSACSAATSRSYIDAGSTTFTASSSRDLKENLKPIEAPSILDKIARVGVYNYDFINGPKDKIGLMAEDFHTVLNHGSDKVINGQEVEMALWLAVQELTARNKELASRLETLEARLAAQAANQQPQ